jgi:hypothetical protein
MVKDLNIQKQQQTTPLPASWSPLVAARRRKIILPAKVPHQTPLISLAPAKSTQAKLPPAEVVMPEKPTQDHPQNDNSPKKVNPYDVHSEGPLTYFNFYVEDPLVLSSKSVSHKKMDKSVLFYRGIIGAGVVAATIASGLAIADVLQKPPAEKDDKSNDAKLKKRSEIALPNSTAATPERLNDPGFSSASTAKLSQIPTRPSTTSRSPISPSQTPPRSQNQPRLGNPLPPLTETALLNNPSLLNNRPPLPPLPARDSTPIKLNTPPTLRQVSPQRAATLPTIAPPETFQSATPLSPGLQAALNAANTTPRPGNSSITTPSQPPGGTGTSAAASNNQLGTGITGTDTTGTVPALTGTSQASPSNLSATPPSAGRSTPESTTKQQSVAEATAPLNRSPASDSTPMPPTTEDPRSFNRLLALRTPDPVDNSPEITPSKPSNPPSDSPANGLPQGIREYIVLGQKPAEVRRVSLMPLTEKAAIEAMNTQQVGNFSIRRVAAQEYQKEWLTSNPDSTDTSMALAFPAYGFIDYQRQVIVVLQDPTSSAQSSQKISTPSS